jgi:hypothetical protein
VRNNVSWPQVRTVRVNHLSLADTTNRFEYLWEDGVKYKRPTKLAAPDYVDALMNWVQNLIDDESVFPNKIGTPPQPCKVSMGIFNLIFRCSIPP